MIGRAKAIGGKKVELTIPIYIRTDSSEKGGICEIVCDSSLRLIEESAIDDFPRCKHTRIKRAAVMHAKTTRLASAMVVLVSCTRGHSSVSSQTHWSLYINKTWQRLIIIRLLPKKTNESCQRANVQSSGRRHDQPIIHVGDKNLSSLPIRGAERRRIRLSNGGSVLGNKYISKV
jgi:hypothetical protein